MFWLVEFDEEGQRWAHRLLELSELQHHHSFGIAHSHKAGQIKLLLCGLLLPNGHNSIQLQLDLVSTVLHLPCFLRPDLQSAHESLQQLCQSEEGSSTRGSWFLDLPLFLLQLSELTAHCLQLLLQPHVLLPQLDYLSQVAFLGVLGKEGAIEGEGRWRRGWLGSVELFGIL